MSNNDRADELIEEYIARRREEAMQAGISEDDADSGLLLYGALSDMAEDFLELKDSQNG